MVGKNKKKRIAAIFFMIFFFSLIVIFQGKEQILAAEEDTTAEGTAASKAAAADTGRRTVKVGFSQIEGLSTVGEDGKHSGLIIDYLNEIAKYTNWEYEYIETSVENSFNDFAAGKFDLMGGIMYAQNLEEYFAYPKYSAGNSRAMLLARKDDLTMRGYDLHTLNGKTIGVYERAGEKIRRLQEFLTFNAIQCEIKYYKAEDMIDNNLYTYLKNGDVDLLLANDMEKFPDFQIITSFEAQDYYIATTAGNQEILDGLNMALKNIVDADPEFAITCYRENFPEVANRTTQLSEAEQAYIADKKTVSVAVPKDMHPFYCEEKDGEHHNGIVPDLFLKISEFTGLTFTYVYADTYAGAIQLVKDKKADILGCFLESEEEASSNGLVLSKAYIGLNNIIIKNGSADYPSEELTAALIEGRTLPQEIKAKEVQHYPDIYGVLRAVDQGKADFAYGVATTMEDSIQKHRFSNTVPITLVNNNQQIKLAVTRPVTPEVLTILNKAIGSLSDSQKGVILDKNIVSVAPSSFELKDLIYGRPLIFVAVIITFVILIVTVVFIIARTRMKNVLIQSELEKAEAESKAKGEFLSHMSHEIRTPMNAIAGLSELTCMLPDIPEAVGQNLEKIRGSSQYLLALINDILDMSRIDSDMMNIVSEEFSLNDMIQEIESMMSVQSEQREVEFRLDVQTNHDRLIGDSIRLRQVLLNLLSNAFKFTAKGGTVSLVIREESRDENYEQYTFSVNDTGTGIAKEDQKRVFESFEQVGSNMSRSEGTGLGLSISANLVRLMGGKLQLKSEKGKGSEFFFCIGLLKGTESKEKEKKEENKKSLKGIRVLLAEDNELNAEIAIELLKIQGILTERAANGNEAVTLFENSKPGYYKAILMDIQMPEKNGLEATEEIRKSSHPDAGSIAIIAMTANSFKEDTEAAKKAGMNGFIPKPIDSAYLYEMLQQYAGE